MKHYNSNKFYVYIHYRLDTNEPFYVGKGSGKRWKSASGRNRHWNSIVNKVGFYSIKVEENLEEERAYELEAEWYDKLSSDYKLINVVKCGNTLNNLLYLNTVYAKGICGERNPNWGGKTMTEEVKKKLSISRREYDYKLTHKNTGEVLIFDSYKEAGTYFNVDGIHIRKYSYWDNCLFQRVWKVERILKNKFTYTLLNSNDTI